MKKWLPVLFYLARKPYLDPSFPSTRVQTAESMENKTEQPSSQLKEEKSRDRHHLE